MTVFLDFETRSRVDLTKQGGWPYAESDSSELLCGVALHDRGPKHPAVERTATAAAVARAEVLAPGVNLNAPDLG